MLAIAPPPPPHKRGEPSDRPTSASLHPRGRESPLSRERRGERLSLLKQRRLPLSYPRLSPSFSSLPVAIRTHTAFVEPPPSLFLPLEAAAAALLLIVHYSLSLLFSRTLVIRRLGVHLKTEEKAREFGWGPHHNLAAANNKVGHTFLCILGEKEKNKI